MQSSFAGPRFLLQVAILVGVALVLSTSDRLAAAQPQPATETDSDVEILAPVYVTLMLARDEAVHAELRLARGQTSAIAAAVTEVDHPLWLLRDVPVKKCAAKLDHHLATLRGHLERTLSAEQLARFNQLVMQARGSKALLAADVVKRLELSSAQREQLEKLVAETKRGSLDPRRIEEVLSPEQHVVVAAMFGKPFDLAQVTRVGCVAPELHGVAAWINSEPMSLSQLRGKVVVVHSWAFGCVNCIHNMPHYQAWFERFPKSGLTIIGIHTPETSGERSLDNLRDNVKQREIAYPVAFDAASENWKAWANSMWPSVYLIDKRGRVRAWWYGELNWQGARGEDTMRGKIEHLLAEK